MSFRASVLLPKRRSYELSDHWPNSPTRPPAAHREKRTIDTLRRGTPMSILNFFRKKQKVPAVDASDAICMILTRREEPPGDDALREALPAIFKLGASSDKGDTRRWMLEVPFVERALVAFIPQPVPNGVAEAAADMPLWADGPAEAKHCSHVVVACRAAKGDAIDSALLLTAIVRSLLDVFDATAVYWQAGAVTAPRKRFDFIAAFATREQLPLELWCRFHLFRVDDQHGGLHTIGMRQFGAMEIEIERSSWKPRQLVDFAQKVASYILTSGAVVKDGVRDLGGEVGDAHGLE